MLPSAKERSSLTSCLKQLIGKDASYCYTYDWECKELSGYSKVEYAEVLIGISEAGFVKRCEKYAKKPLVLRGKKKFYARLESYGHSKSGRVLFGVNPVAAALDRLLFDYVYVFFEEEAEARKNIKRKIDHAIKNERYREALALMDCNQELFREENRAKRLRCEKKLKEL